MPKTINKYRLVAAIDTQSLNTIGKQSYNQPNQATASYNYKWDKFTKLARRFLALTQRRTSMKRQTNKKLMTWTKLAAEVAQDAHENHFSSRRGGYVIQAEDGATVIAIYDNNPWAHDSGLRDRQLVVFRRRLKEAGIAEFDFATYPRRGESVGYTYSMILAGGVNELPIVFGAMRESLITT